METVVTPPPSGRLYPIPSAPEDTGLRPDGPRVEFSFGPGRGPRTLSRRECRNTGVVTGTVGRPRIRLSRPDPGRPQSLRRMGQDPHTWFPLLSLPPSTSDSLLFTYLRRSLLSCLSPYFSPSLVRPFGNPPRVLPIVRSPHPVWVSSRAPSRHRGLVPGRRTHFTPSRVARDVDGPTAVTSPYKIP